MTTEELQKVGFRHRYKPTIKGVDKNSLGYVCHFTKGKGMIHFELSYHDASKMWEIGYINFEGEYALSLIKKYLDKYSINSITKFIEKYKANSLTETASS